MTTAMPMRRREFHAATLRSADTLSGAQQMLMPYRHAKLATVASGFEFKPGFIYAQVRAISARINQNYDGWPSTELKKAYRTFIGKPCFVNHQNFDPRRARGKVVAARYVEAGDDKYIETVMEIDAMRFPKLAHEIKTGGMDSVSMGVEAGFTICSFCGNKAVDTPDFCEHVKYHKGRKLRTASGEERLVYEKCYKLGFFELSWVFDPADETAVTSRVISASVADNEARIHRLAYGEIEAPEDVDTLRNEDENDTDDFKHYVESPKELQGPDLDQTKQLDRVQEDQGLDADRRSEDVEDIGGAPMPPARNARRQRRAAPFADPRDAIDQDRPFTPGEERALNDTHTHPAPLLIDPRTGRRYVAADDLPPDFGGGDPSGADPAADPSMGGGDPLGGGGDPTDPSGGGDPSLGGQSDEELINQAQQDLQQYEDSQGGDDDFSSDEGGTDDDYADQDFGGDDDSDGFDDDADGSDSDYSDDDSDGSDDDSADADDGSGDLPPWLNSSDDSPDDTDPSKLARRRKGNSRSSNQKKRRARRGAPMSLAQRSRVAATQGPRRHYADDSGHVDGGPYHVDDNDQGEQEEVFISDTPGSEAVAAPTPGDGTISNTENNLVARINKRSRDLQRDIIAYEQITGRRVTAEDYDPTGGNMAVPTPHPSFPGQEYGGLGEPGRHNPGPHTARRRYADDGEWPSPGEQSVSGTEKPDTVDPALSGTDQQGLKGDFDNIALDSVETQPKDASRHYFAEFDRWVRSATGKTASQHGAVWLRRQAARFCQAKGIPVEAMFPTLGIALREARKSEGNTNRRANMRKRADEKLDVAAPQDRIDVEAPVSDTTDADAQASQFDLGDFGSNAGDNLADPDLSPDSQIWAPGEGDSSRTSNKKADGITAVRYAEAYIRAGLAPNTADEKWKVAGLAMTMRQGTILDRISILDAVNAQRAAAARRTAGVNRGAGRSVPPGLGQRQLTAGQAREAANDLSGDVAIWLK